MGLRHAGNDFMSTREDSKRSRGSLKALFAEENDFGANSLPDSRSAELESLGVDPAALSTIKEVFAGTKLAENQEKVRRILLARSEIQKEWGDARDSFLAIGRALLDLEQSLTKTEFALLRRGTERLFPFSDATATQLRQIARAVDGGRIPLQACPGSYGTAYQITLLTDTQMQIAHERGLIRPDVTRREIMQLRRDVRLVDAEPEPPARVDPVRLREERTHLAERQGRLKDEINIIERRLAHIDDLLSRR